MSKLPFHLPGNHFVCLPCRRSIKHTATYFWDNEIIPHQRSPRMQNVVCPECGGDMFCLGKNFKPPLRRDLRQWKKLEWMIQNGWRGHSWPTEPKMELREVQESFAIRTQAQKDANKIMEDAALFERRRAANGYSRSRAAKKRLKSELKRQEKYQKTVLESLATKEHRSA